MIKLSDKMVADGHKPWCVGIESGDGDRLAADGLDGRGHAPHVRPGRLRPVGQPQDPVQRPQGRERAQRGRQIVKNPKYVNAGIGDVKSIATTAFQKGGLPIETGKCMLHAAGELLRGQLGQGLHGGQDGDLYAFYEPTDEHQVRQADRGRRRVRRRVLATVPRSRPCSSTWPAASGPTKAALNAGRTSGWATANQKVDKSVFIDPIDKLSVQHADRPEAPRSGSTVRTPCRPRSVRARSGRR